MVKIIRIFTKFNGENDNDDDGGDDADAWAAASWHIGLVFGCFQMLIQHQLQRGSATIWNTDL